MNAVVCEEGHLVLDLNGFWSQWKNFEGEVSMWFYFRLPHQDPSCIVLNVLKPIIMGSIR